jgi:hypothetical protein
MIGLLAVSNVLDRQRWLTRHELRLAITTWIERIASRGHQNTVEKTCRSG